MPLYAQVNWDLTVRLAEKARAEGVGQFVFFSNADIYGLIEGVIAKGTVPRSEINLKLEAEALASMSGKGFAVAILRHLIVYGKSCK